jgi:hypothetical protein
MFFGQYLLSKGAITREALLEAIERQRQTNLSLVELAVRHGHIDSDQAETILARYRTTEADLEDLFLEVGSLDADKVDELRRVQRSDWVKIGAALISAGHLTRDEVEEHLAVFQEEQRAADQQLEADFHACKDPKTMRAVVELAIFHLKRFTDRPVKLQALSVGEGELAPGLQRYAQKLQGDRELYVALDLPPEISALVAQRFVGFAVAAGSEVEVDAVCECVNIIGGHACTQLESSGFKLRPEPPFSTFDNRPADEASSSVRASVIAGDSSVDVRVFV